MRGFIGFFYLLLAGCPVVLASVDLSPEQTAFFETEVRPLLVKHCYECHSREEKVKGGLRLDTREGWMAGSLISDNPLVGPLER